MTALCAYGLLAALYTWPLAANLRTALPSDPADPSLNAAILRWNATTLPFSAEWWSAPHYFPTDTVAAFTENLQGISVTATPVFWLTGSAIAAHNVSYFLTWPLSAFAVFLLVSRLTGRRDAAFPAGLIFAFTPYRTAEIAHIQSLSAFWLPVALLAAHAYLDEGRRRWLWLFAIAWLLQALSNGHYMLFGAIVIGLWMAYFSSPAVRWRRALALSVTLVVASLPLAPVLLTYSAVHLRYGLKRDYNEILAYSARPHSWFETTGDAWFWRQFLPVGKDALYPGAAGVLCVVIAALVLMRRHRARQPVRGAAGWVRACAAVVGGVGMLATLAGLWLGPWSASVAGFSIRMATLNRAVVVTVAALTVAAALTPQLRRAWQRRSPLLFYAVMVLVIAIFCIGPVLHVGTVAMLQPAPYRWLMVLPGFDELRVPPRFWMLGVMCLAVAAGLGLNRLTAVPWLRRTLVFTVSMLALLDGWMPTMRMVAAPVETSLEAAGRAVPILELPLGVEWDWDAVYRASGHRRRVFNGVSGYDPPHYDALRFGLTQRDPAVLVAMASLSEFDVVVNGAVDPDGLMARYVSEVPGVQLVRVEGARRLYHVPRGTAEPQLGVALPIAGVQTMRLRELFATRRDAPREVVDGRIDTGWDDYPQGAGQWVAVDLGREQRVGGVTHSLGRSFLAFPRRLEIQTSTDGQRWERVWEGRAAAQAFLALVRQPLEGPMRFTFPAREARYVRLLQLDDAPQQWHVAELTVHAP